LSLWTVAIWLDDAPAFRMFSSDSVIAATAGLDTTNFKYAEERREINFEYYLSGLDQMYISVLRHPRVFYFLLFVEVARPIALFFFHRWIKKLTAESIVQP
jgi:hypothetical protein